MKGRYYLHSLGCPKNLVDSEAMAMLLERSGYRGVADPREADVLIVNTCGFLQSAQKEALDVLGALSSIKRPGQTLVAAGCMVERNPEKIEADAPGVDVLLGTYRWSELPKILSVPRSRRHAKYELLGEPDHLWKGPFPRSRVVGGTAYLKISDGCNANCAFCSIPSFKGKLKSRPMPDIVREAIELVGLGAKEIVLVAQDTTDYGRDLGMSAGLAGLVDAILDAVPELRWLRIMYAYPSHVTPALIETMSRRDQVCHYLDIPLQHGHPDVLKRMRRPNRIDEVLSTIGSLRSAMPDIALRSTFIVGFPGETEEEFDTLLEFLKEIRFDHVGAFEFSPEPGTPAADMPGQVPEEVKHERYDRLMKLQRKISAERNAAQVGREMFVLVEGADEEGSFGRTYRDAPEIDGLVYLDKTVATGRMVKSRVLDSSEYDLYGEVMD